MPLESTPMLISAYESGSRILGISIGPPQRKLNEVYYAVDVGMPSGLSLPLAFGMYTLLMGAGR